jgi:hypothetical protein
MCNFYKLIIVIIIICVYFYQIGGRQLDVQRMAESFVETELGRLETELKSLHAQQPRLSGSDEVHLLFILKAALGDDKDVFSDLLAPTLDAVAGSNKLENKLDRYTSGLLLQLKMKFVILVKEAIISSNTQAAPTAPEGHENEDIIVEAPTVAAAAAASSEEEAAPEPPVYVDIEQLMPSATEQQLYQVAFVKACHKDAKEKTESEFNLVLERSNVATEKKVEFLERFRSLLERRLDKLLKKNDDKSKPQEEGPTTRKRPHPNREEDELNNSHKKKLPAGAEAGRDDYIKGEMNRLAREYERLMKQHLAAYVEFPSTFSHPSSLSGSGAPPQLVDPPPPPPTLSIVIHLGWNHTHVGWTPPNKTTTVELLFPPIPSLIGLSEDESEILYGSQVYEALGKTLPSQETRLGSYKVSSFLNLKSMLRGKEVGWRKGQASVKSELPLAIFLIHVKTKIESAILPSSRNYKVIMVLPQVLSIVQRGRISDAAKLAGFGEDQVHLIKETTAAALAFAHDEDMWSPGSMLPIILVCCRPTVYDSNTDDNNVDAAVFSNEDGILTMGESAGRQGLQLMELRNEMTKFQTNIAPFADDMNKNSVIVYLDDDGSYKNVPCSHKGEMQDFRALHDRVKRRSASESDHLLNKIRKHLTKNTVRYLHWLYDSCKRVYLYMCLYLCYFIWLIIER